MNYRIFYSDRPKILKKDKLKSNMNCEKQEMSNDKKTMDLLTSIDKIVVGCHSSETQTTGDKHEKNVGNILQLHLDCDLVDKVKFNNLLKKNNIKQKSKEFKNIPPEEISIEDPCGFSYDKNYIVHQPFGSQAYPDFIVFRINVYSAKLCFIECKQKKPTWNNTPPKKFKGCLYVCGNKVYNGYIILSDSELKIINDYKKKYEELVNEFNNLSSIKFVMYKKIELTKWPTKYFTENETNNIEYIHETLSRFY